MDSLTPQEIAQLVRSGEYYKQARAWYTTKYMLVLSERFFFIVLTTIAGLTMFFAVIGLIGLMPINEQVPFYYYSRDISRELPLMQPLRKNKLESINNAVRRFYVSKYVENRENYILSKLQAQFKMIQKHSDEAAFAAYRRFIDPSNPRSPITLYQRNKTKEVQITNVYIIPDRQPGRYNAAVDFTTTVKSMGTETRGVWQAQLLFSYQDLTVDQTEEKSDKPLKVTPMKFSVLEYTARELR